MFQLGGNLLLAAAGIAALHFWFADVVVPETASRLDLWQARDFAALPPLAAPRDAPSWFADGTTVVHVEGSSPDGRRLDRPSVIVRTPDGRLERFLKAETARFRDGGWVLFEVRRPLEAGAPTRGRVPINVTLDPERFSVLSGKPEELRFATLLSLARQADFGQRPASYYSFWAHRKLAQPAASLIMVLLALPIGLQAGGRGRIHMTGLIVLASGFLFLIFERLLIPMGENGLLPPPMAAWTPFAVFAALGAWVLLNQET
jgi:lipopolysaccharide export system permease protein